MTTASRCRSSTTGSARLAWAIARLVGAETVDVVLFDAGPDGDAVARRTDLCLAGSEPGAPTTVHERTAEITLYEECDDGNTSDGDGCSTTCLNECAARGSCGNGRIDAGETCDDGNLGAGDGCSPGCVREP